MPSPVVGFLMRPLLRRSLLAACIYAARRGRNPLGAKNLGPARTVNIAGGPSADSLNALMMLRRLSRGFAVFRVE